MPEAGNGESTLSDENSQGQESSSNHSSQHSDNETSDVVGSDDLSDKDDETSDPIVVSPGPSIPPESPETEDRSPGAASDDEEPPAQRTIDTTQLKLFPEATPTCEVPPTLSFITVGLQRKATPWQIKSWAALALTLDGRDKITKVLQYSCRLLGWRLAAGPNKDAAARFTMLYKSLAKSRKAFRLGRSFIEFDKLRSMGLTGLVCWHLEQSLKDTDAQEEAHPKPTIFARRASSNIAWGPSLLQEDIGYDSRRSLARSLSSMTYRKIYRPLLSRMSSVFASPDTPTMELWKALGSAIKMIGLLGFWAGDNMNFLFSTGALDDLSVPQKQRLAKRSSWQTTCGIKANQAYFGGSLAGLLVNWYAYIKFRRTTLSDAEERIEESESPEDRERSIQQLQKTKEKQFSLFLALLKSCCDIVVFSNMPGIDLHKRFRGKKNHEGLHCVCGLISASTVIYNNFPDAK